MLNLKHTICPSCSTGCGITLISNNKELLGTYPYKRHEINEEKTVKMADTVLQTIHLIKSMNLP